MHDNNCNIYNRSVQKEKMFYPPKGIHHQDQTQNDGCTPKAASPGFPRQRWDGSRSHRPHHTAGGNKDKMVRDSRRQRPTPAKNNGHQGQTKPWDVAALSWVALPLRWAPFLSGACTTIFTTLLRCGGKYHKLLGKNSLLLRLWEKKDYVWDPSCIISPWLSSQAAEIFCRYVRLEDGEKHILYGVLYQHINFQSKLQRLPGIKRKAFWTILK